MEEQEKSSKEEHIGDSSLLGEAEIGTSGVIVSVQGEGKLRRRLFDMGLTPGASLYVRKKAPLGDPLEITIRGYELTLRHQEAMNVVIRITELEEKKESQENGK